MMTNPEKSRPFQPDDEAGILELRGKVLSSGRSLKYWNWQFKDHPHGPGWITVAAVETEIVSQHALRGR